MKIGRNDPCPCGSGKKYKRCCLNKAKEQYLAEAIMYSLQNIKRESQIKRCLHPNSSECSDRIVKAHAIQNNRILNKIGESGMVVTMDGTMHHLFQTSDMKGRSIATTFTGFCSYHDKTVFQEIEDKEFVASEKQIFLITYRTMAWHYHKKQVQTNATCIQYEKMFEKGYNLGESDDFIEYLGALKLGLEDNEIEKQRFDDALLEEKYCVTNSLVWEIPYEINFAVSMMTELEHDILGNRINDMEKDERIKKIYLNIFPAKDKSFCIWSWLNYNDSFYAPFSNQFLSLSVVDRENYFNNNLPRWTDSIVISPRLWKKWGAAIQEAFITHANFDILYRQMEAEKNDYAYQYMDTPWNLFENVSVAE